jgi:hypothetical protein
VIPVGQETEWVEDLVRSRIVENWEAQDTPEHLKTIRDRILKSGLRTSRLLGLYQQVLEHESIPADDSLEQMDLRLTGLVVKQAGTLKVYNPIYALVFNQAWLSKAFSNLRPYAELLDSWVASGCQDDSRLLRGQALRDAQAWAEGKSLADQDYQFLAASQDIDKRDVQIALEAQTQANEILADAQRKARRNIRIGSAVLVGTILLATVAAAFAGKANYDRVVAQEEQTEAIAQRNRANAERDAASAEKEEVERQIAATEEKARRAEAAAKQQVAQLNKKSMQCRPTTSELLKRQGKKQQN